MQRDNPEVFAVHALRIPVIRRAEMLAELMRLKFQPGSGRLARRQDDDDSLLTTVLKRPVLIRRR